MTFCEYLEQVVKNKEQNPNWRMGQTYFNTLDDVHPDLADQVRGNSKLDPFYRDERIVDFLTFVCENWG